ncbi:Prefoldin subunit-domain-containing protein [Sporodiniella umbellata]|nr:Prefoldin subunit-domain-containing protein [Sporodiniella umbellata]
MTERETRDLNELIRKYDEFINLKLKPSLQKELEQRDIIFNLQTEYRKLHSQIDLMQSDNAKELKLMTDLGSQFYAQAHIPDTTHIYVNVGFGFHVQFTLNEAKTFIEKKEKQLQKQADKHSSEADKIRAHIKMVCS